jgi:hypothetical protein
MSKTILFVQTQGRPDVVEIELAEGASVGDLHAALAAAGIQVDAETSIFIDEAEEHLHGGHHEPLPKLKHGSRVHVCRCRRVSCTVNYLDKTAERLFPPGVRVRAVKAWAVHQFGLNPKDAAEHVLQICGSSDRPASDTPLQQLVQGHRCQVCFDLVPEKRVEG